MEEQESDQFIEALGEKAWSLTLEEMISKSTRQITDLFPENEFQKFKDETASKIGKGLITDETMFNDRWEMLEEGPHYRHRLHAVIYLILTEHHLAQGEKNKAWALIATAGNECGIAEGTIPPIPIKPEHLEKTRQGYQRGGVNNAKRYIRLKKEIISLLLKKRPPTLWPLKTNAIEAIFPALEVFNKEKGRTITPTNLKKTVWDWSRDDPNVRQAFADCVAAKISR